MTTPIPSLVDILKKEENKGREGGIGHKAASAALVAGYSPSAISEALTTLGVDNQGLKDDLGSTAPTSGWGTHGIQEQDVEARGGQSSADARSEFVGAADIAFMQHQGMNDLQIQNYIRENNLQNPEGGLAYQQSIKDLGKGATIVTQGNQIGGLKTDIGTLEGTIGGLKTDIKNWENKYGDLKKDYDTAMLTAQEAKEEAMKIKYTGSTQVRNPSAMGIQAAQGTPFRGSGLAGTAALARPNKGLRIRTLNV